MTLDTQNDRILKHLEHASLTRKQAMDKLGIANLTARIAELRQAGYAVGDDWMTVRNRYGELTKFKVYKLA